MTQNTIDLEQTGHENKSGPVTCLGMTFENDEARRAHFTEELRKKLQDTVRGNPISLTAPCAISACWRSFATPNHRLSSVTDQPEAVLVCERGEEGTVLRRLNSLKQKLNNTQ